MLFKGSTCKPAVDGSSKKIGGSIISVLLQSYKCIIHKIPGRPLGELLQAVLLFLRKTCVSDRVP